MRVGGADTIHTVQAVSQNPTTPPVAPDSLRLVKPRPGAERCARAEKLLDALQRGEWVGDGRYAKIAGEDFVYLGELEVDGEHVAVALKQIVAPKGLAGVIDAIRSNRRSVRQWVGAERLAALDVPTALPILLASGSRGGARCDWLLLEQLTGDTLLDHLHKNDLSFKEERNAAQQVGSLVARIDSFGWFNRDCKLSNLIRQPDGIIAVIDTVGIQRRPGKRERMLSAMLAEAVGHGVLPRRTLLMRCLINAVEDPRDAWRTLSQLAASKTATWQQCVLHEKPARTGQK